MGRAFEFRKERKFKRWGHMARTFTKIGKEITIAVKQGGPDVTGNPRLRALIQTARSENMPKDNIERAIKRASDKDQSDYKEIVLEGYGPHGVAFLVEAATDNNNRTVANVRSYFTKSGGSLGTSGSGDYMFDHKCFFRMKSENLLTLRNWNWNSLTTVLMKYSKRRMKTETRKSTSMVNTQPSTISRSSSKSKDMSWFQQNLQEFLMLISRILRQKIVLSWTNL